MPGYVMSAAEVTFWQDQAALLDPDAHVLVIGANQSVTVPGGEHWYLRSGWYIQATGGGTHFFQRHAQADEALILPAGRTLTTHASIAISLMYLCKPSLVVGSDARYASDPRALYFERMIRLGNLAQSTIGVVETGAGTPTAAFPNDFTDGLVVHVSTHGVAWSGLLVNGTTAVPPLQDEISDADPVRMANPVMFPFKRTTFPNIQAYGANAVDGRATITYVKLPADW